MSTTATRRVTVPNPQGLHARPSSLLVKTAMTFSSEITVENTRSGAIADAKFLLEVMTLAAGKGDELEIRAAGADAEAAADALADLVDGGFGET